MVDGADLPPKGSTVRIDRGSFSATGVVVWEKKNTRGIRFDKAIDVEAWVRRVGHSGQQLVDRTVQALKAGTTPPGSDGPPPRSVSELARELTQICEQVAALPNLSIDVGESLVRIEAIAVELMRLDAA